MSNLEALREFALVDALCRGLPRRPDQVNARHEADAELVPLPGGGHLAVTIDGLQEEYLHGVLTDPELVGWANVVHSLSDLAAVGARPLGVLLSYTLPPDADEAWRAALTAGAAAALEAHGTYCLGGDTSFGDPAGFHSVGVGVVDGDGYLTRRGARPGDPIYLTGPAGLGNLLGLTRNIDGDLWAEVQPLYRPRVRFDLVAAARPAIRAAVDTSDGLLASLDLLTRLEGLGVRVLDRPGLYHPQLRALSEKLGTPLWIGGAFGMGEYELALVVAAEREAEFLAAAAGVGVEPLKAAEVREAPGMALAWPDGDVELDPAKLLNLFAESDGPEGYVAALFEFDKSLRGGA